MSARPTPCVISVGSCIPVGRHLDLRNEQAHLASMDPHQNLFYAYRGPNRLPVDEVVWDRQLENNTTKALINVMSMLPRESGLLPFIQLVSPGVRPRTAQTPVDFLLQRVPALAREAHLKLAVLIRPARAIPAASQPGGKPDAFIVARNASFAILIESKLAASYSQEQLEGHLRAAGWPEGHNWLELTWEEIYGAYAARLPAAIEPASTLLKQFPELPGVDWHGSIRWLLRR